MQDTPAVYSKRQRPSGFVPSFHREKGCCARVGLLLHGVISPASSLSVAAILPQQAVHRPKQISVLGLCSSGNDSERAV
jgi:hypothetical protein